MENIINILIVDDSIHFSKNLVDFFDLYSKDLKILAIARTKEQAVKYANHYKPDVILMDIELTEDNYDGMEAAMEIYDSKLKTKIIILTSMNPSNKIKNYSVLSGAVHFINKLQFEQLPSIIRKIHTDTDCLESIQNEFIELKKEFVIKELSSTEKYIFLLAVNGMSEKQIADATMKSMDTIKTQIRSICNKLEVKNLQQAIQKYKNRGIIP